MGEKIMFPWDSWFLHNLLPKEEISSQSLFVLLFPCLMYNWTECQGDCKKLGFKEHIDVQAERLFAGCVKKEKKNIW